MLAEKRVDMHPKGIHSLDDYDFSSKYDYEYIVYVKILSEEKDIHRLSGDWTIQCIIYDNDKKKCIQ